MKKRPIDNKIKEKVNINFSFDEIENKIDIEKYEKKNMKRNIFPLLAPVACSFLCFAIIGVTILGGKHNNSNENISSSLEISNSTNENIETSDDAISYEEISETITSQEDLPISEETPINSYESVISEIPEGGYPTSDNEVEGDVYDEYNGPMIDLIKGESPYDHSSGPSLRLSLFEVIVGEASIYEVSYLGNIKNKYYCAYVDINTAEEIYDAYKNVLDAETASETHIIDGSIIKWFYAKNYSNELISWYEFSFDQNIPRIINDKMVLGVYLYESVCINKEIRTSSSIERTYDYFRSKYYVYENGPYIKASYNGENIKKVWYPSMFDINELNLDELTFNNFSYKFNDFMNIGLINDNEIKLDEMHIYENQIDSDIEKWNSFVNDAKAFHIENNLYYYDEIVNLIIEYINK